MTKEARCKTADVLVLLNRIKHNINRVLRDLDVRRVMLLPTISATVVHNDSLLQSGERGT